jgi:sirohydrochlorin cobaltochelatase
LWNLHKNFIIGYIFYPNYKFMLASSPAYLLIAHGSRDLRTTQALQRLTAACAAKLQTKLELADDSLFLGTAYLELSALPIVEQIVVFAERAAQHNYLQVKILPLFLAPGVHVLTDLPQAIEQAQDQLAGRCQLELLTYLGGQASLQSILQQHRQQLPVPQILLAHGSPQATAQEFLTTLTTRLHTIPAYWSVNPSLAEQVSQLVAYHHTEIGILPYFLFPGRISAALTATVNELQSLFPDVQFKFSRGGLETSLLDTDPQIIDLVVQVLCPT